MLSLSTPFIYQTSSYQCLVWELSGLKFNCKVVHFQSATCTFSAVGCDKFSSAETISFVHLVYGGWDVIGTIFRTRFLLHIIIYISISLLLISRQWQMMWIMVPHSGHNPRGVPIPGAYSSPVFGQFEGEGRVSCRICGRTLVVLVTMHTVACSIQYLVALLSFIPSALLCMPCCKC